MPNLEQFQQEKQLRSDDSHSSTEPQEKRKKEKQVLIISVQYKPTDQSPTKHTEHDSFNVCSSH